jgi:hypothetical protein
LMMEEQLERVRRETEVNYAATRRVEEALAEAADVARKVAEQEESEKAVPRGGEEESEEEKARRRDREGWRLIMEAV